MNQPVYAGFADAQGTGHLGRGHHIGIVLEQAQPPLKRLIAAVSLHFQGALIDAAAESSIGFRFRYLHIGVLIRQRNIADQKHLGKAGHLVAVAARQHQGIAVQKLEHIRDGQTAAKLVKQDNILTPIVIKGMGVIGNMENIFLAVQRQDAPGFADSGFAPQIGYRQGPPLTAEPVFQQCLPGGFNML